jgi:maltooligosyltrehalose trehalohydrolase
MTRWGTGRGGRTEGHLLTTGQLKIERLLHDLPFVPMLFQGEEWGASTPFLYFTDHGEPELGKAVWRGGRRCLPDSAGTPMPYRTPRPGTHPALKAQVG